MSARLRTFAAVLALALCARPARAQDMVETGNLTSQSATTERPDWARDNAQGPARRFVGRGSGIADGSWFKSMGVEPGSFTNYIHQNTQGLGNPLSGGRGPNSAGTQVTYLPPPLPRKPRSNAPARVAGLVYEVGTKHPVAGALVRLVSTDPAWAVEHIEARTDSAGYYEFAHVEPGPWRLGLVQDALATEWVPPRIGRAITLAKRDTLVAAPFELRKAACVTGHGTWSDGYVLFDAPMTVAPEDTSLGSLTGLMNGVGDFHVCGAPEESVMVWMHLRDGRSLGRTVRLGEESPALSFVPEPVDKMAGCTLRVLPVLNDGTPVPRARITVVGRRFEQGDRPAMVYVRDEQADADGMAEFRVPFGVYQVLVVNPREGQTGHVSGMVVDHDQDGAQALKVEMRDPVSPEQQARMRADLLDRAETYLYVWTQ